MTPQTAPQQALLTIAELSRNLDLPESTTRYYCNRFAAHLPSIGEGRKRRFKQEAQETLQLIADTMRRNKNAFAVDLMLKERQEASIADSLPVTAPTSAPEAAPAGGPQVSFAPDSQQFAGQILSLMENQTKALQDIAGALNAIAKRTPLAESAAANETDGENATESAPPAPASTENEDATEAPALREEITALREQMRTAENVHQNDLEQLRKWLGRLGEALAAK